LDLSLKRILLFIIAIVSFFVEHFLDPKDPASPVIQEYKLPEDRNL